MKKMPIKKCKKCSNIKNIKIGKPIKEKLTYCRCGNAELNRFHFTVLYSAFYAKDFKKCPICGGMIYIGE